MAFVPDIKYPDIITQIETMDQPIMCGSRYNIEAMTGGFIYFGTIIHINCSEFDQSVHNSEANALTKLVLIFRSGVALYVSVWCETDQSIGPVKIKIYSSNSVLYAIMTLQGSVAQGSFTCSPADLRNEGLKFAFYTDYYDWASAPVRGITPPFYFVGCCYAPARGYSAGSSDVVNMGENIQSNVQLLWFKDPERPGVPSFYSDYIPPFQVNFLSTSNVDDAMTRIGYTDPADGYDTGEMPDPDAPPQEYDPSEPGGGGGNYDPTSDPVDYPGLPTGGAVNSGSIKAFVVSPGIMRAVFVKLWSTAVFDIATWQKLLESPLDSLVELSCIPLIPTAGDTAAIMLGNFDTEETAPVITSQYKTIDCGTKKVNEFWGSALDYEPYTKCEIYLPFTNGGIHKLKTEDIMGKTIGIKYNVDILTGELVAQIKCGQSVLYKFTGNCKATCPVSSKVMDALRPFIHGTMGMALASTPNGVATAAISAAVNVAMSKTQIQRSGNISGAVGLLDDFVPYLIIHRPKQSLARNFNKQKGYPSNITATLSSLSGYTEVEYVHLTGISGATDTELNEIEALLKKGVII